MCIHTHTYTKGGREGKERGRGRRREGEGAGSERGGRVFLRIFAYKFKPVSLFKFRCVKVLLN